MKRSEINSIIREAKLRFETHGWTLPPAPKWDVTDFGLGDFENKGLVLVNLADEPEYCEKLMYARQNQLTPMHCHAKKKEDIISRFGTLIVEVWNGKPNPKHKGMALQVQINGHAISVGNGDCVQLDSGERITLIPGFYHSFYSKSEYCVIGEVSTANDDINDNFFIDPNIGRFPKVDEDEKTDVVLCSD